MKKAKGILSIAILGIVWVCEASDYSTKPAVRGEFVVEYKYNYVESKYDPPVAVDKTMLRKRDNASPESVMTNHFLSMMSGDYDSWIEGWDRSSREMILKDDEEKGITPSKWISGWKKLFEGRGLELLSRVESGEYILITYRVFNLGDNKEIYKAMLATKKFEEGWMVTQELARDHMYHHFMERKDRVSRYIR